ncbi:MAG: sporulation protein YqfC [Halanaerobiaceae bacterium]|nr:sporulation protein YqfC [Halanaerobiaceae bacterium]
MDKLKRQFIRVFELPPDIIMDLPLLMLVADNKLYLENHKGISYFQSEEIKIKIKYGFIIITGRNLSISEINRESLAVSGKILSITYEQRGGDRP